MAKHKTNIEISTLIDKMMAMACSICSIDFDETAPYPTMTMLDMSNALARIDARIGELCCKCIANTRTDAHATIICILRANRELRKSMNARESREITTARVCTILDENGMGALLLAYIARKELAMTSLVYT